MNHSSRRKESVGGRIFTFVNTAILVLIALVCLLPFINIIASSFATTQEVMAKRFILFPTTFSLDAYRYILSTPTIFRGLGVSMGVTIAGTVVSMLLTALMAYGLSRRYLPARNTINFIVVFSMLFSGGMIPTFLVVKSVGLINSYGSLIFPVAVNAFNMIIMRNFFQALPDSLEESAKIDGSNDFGIFMRIMLPLALPSIATISLFYAVAYWNTYMNAILYMNDSAKWPIQVLLRQIVIVSSGMQAEEARSILYRRPRPSKWRSLSSPPCRCWPLILCTKHFTKGALLGAVKG